MAQICTDAWGNLVNYGGKRVLIIGGTGFIGGRLAERLLVERGAQVRVPVRDWRKAAWISRTAAELVPGDVTDPKSMVSAAFECDVVFHCASGPADDGGYMRTNKEGTRNVIAACIDSRVERLVYVSSVAVHGARRGTKLSSDTPLIELGRDYSDSKIAAEKLVECAQASGALNTVIVRPTYVWGPRSAAFTIRQIREMITKTFRYVDHGNAVANAVYIDNLVDALIASGIDPGASGRRFLITDGADYRWRDLFGHYAEYLNIGDLPSVSSQSALAQLGGKALDFAEATLGAMKGTRSLPIRVLRRMAKIGRDQLRRRFVDSFELNKFSCNVIADIDDARVFLNYAPQFSLEAGVAEIIRWLNDQMEFELSQLRRST